MSKDEGMTKLESLFDIRALELFVVIRYSDFVVFPW